MHKLRPLLILSLLVCSCWLSAQTEGQNAICADDSCSDELNNITLNEAKDPPGGTYFPARTEAFKTAYVQFREIRDQHRADANWMNKYRTSALGGRKCLRYYDLESRFAYESDNNPDFKAYIEGAETNVSAFRQSGFESSRRGMNLDFRMRKDCPNEVRKSEKDGTAPLEDRQSVYQKLGEVQGYWDKEGNTLKPLEAIPNATPDEKPQKRKSKKQQVEDLTQAVAGLPLGQATQDKVNKLTSGLNDLAPKADDLTNKLSQAADKVNSLLPKAGGLLDQVGNLLGLKKPLSSYLPKITGTDIVDKIKKFFGRGKKLKEGAEVLKDKADEFKKELEDTVKKAKSNEKKITDKGKDAKELLEKLEELRKKRDDLNEKLVDKPKKILEELTQEVDDLKRKSDDLTDKIKKGLDDSGKLKDELEKLNKKKDDLEDKIEGVEKEIEDLDQKKEDLEKEGEKLDEEVKKLKKQEDLKQQVEELEPVEDYAKKVAECEEELKNLLGGITKVEEKKEKAKKGLGKLLALPGKLLGKVTNFIEKHSALKVLLGAIPGVSNIMNVVDGLFGKSKVLAGALELITGKQSKLTDTLNGISERVNKVKDVYEDKVAAVTKVKDQVAGFADEKADLLSILGKKIDDLSPVEQRVIDLVKNSGLLGENSACNDLEPLKEEIEEVDEELDEVGPQIEEIKEELENLEAETNEIEAATNEVEEEAKEVEEQVEEIKAEEEAIKEEFGQDVDLEPVTVEEYAESFEIERPYWEATFHPDDEVVEGYKGRYFQVQLKDADQTIKLLFGPGEYHMSKTDFRNNYGSVIGAFVTEALAAIKKDKRAGVKLFVQGSADISGANSFRGNLDESFYYEELSLLPLKGNENFGGTEESRTVRERGFTNDDLPNLRGRFMQEMIGFYSKKLSPILLEGSVKKQVDKEDRNAVIYLFLPESLLGE